VIVEGVVTSLNADGSVNISPMGPEVDALWLRLVLKPYQTSTTYQNLRRTGQAVFHVTDDVELIARTAVGGLVEPPPMAPCAAVEGQILAGACRWYALRVTSFDDLQPRTRIECQVVGSGVLREFLGFNRARHAVLEAAILATRVDLLPRSQIEAEMDRLAVPVAKTAGPAELRAFDFLRAFLAERWAATAASAEQAPQ